MDQVKYPPDVWFQVSRKHRIIARLPEGKTGIEALREAEHAAWSTRFPEVPMPEDAMISCVRFGFEAESGDFFLRIFAMAKEKLSVELTREEFEAYLKNGGTTYTNWYYRMVKEKDERVRNP
jgi:hypothetical protein